MNSADFLVPFLVLMRLGSPWVIKKTLSDILLTLIIQLLYGTHIDRREFIEKTVFCL